MNAFRQISKFLVMGKNIPISAASHLPEVDVEKVLQAKKFKEYLLKIQETKYPLQ